MLDAGIAYLKQNPKIAIVGGVGVAGVAFAVYRARKQAASVTDTSMGTNVSPYGDTGLVTNPLGGTQPGVIAGVGQGPTVVKEVPAKLPNRPGWVNVILNNLKTGVPETTSVRRKANPTHSCPPGYVLTASGTGSKAGDLRCVSANQPVTGSRYAKVKFTPPAKPASKTTKKGSAGEGDYSYQMPRLSESRVPLGFVSPWTTKHAMQLYDRSTDWSYHGE